MTKYKAFKGRIYPNKTQQAKIDYTLNCCRFIYNEMLARNIKVYQRRGEHLGYYDMQRLLKSMKEYLLWLKKADSQALANACRQLDTAYTRFFKHEKKFPRFHKKRGRQSYTSTCPTALKIENNKIWIPTVGFVKLRGIKSLSSDTKICRITVSRESNGKYFVSVFCKQEVNIIPHTINPNNVLGLDYSSAHLYVDSNGDIPNFEHMFSKNQTKLAKKQRSLSRCKCAYKGGKKSSNWNKKFNKVCKIETKIANQRKDMLNKISKKLADNYDAIGVEDINLQTISNKKFGNGKTTMDNGFGMFREMLNYKLQDRGKVLIKVDRFFPSSQLCNCCGYQNKETKNLKIRKWKCPNCGMVHDRDINAAINIREETKRILKDTYELVI